jgi:hypothetical protein
MDLSGCVNDAKDWAKVLKTYGFVVATLLDSKATGDAMRKAFTKMVENSEKDDLLVIQYSGHGTYVPDISGDEPDGRDEALVPYDVMDNGPLIDDEIYSIFRKKKTGSKIIFISDSCHSGTVLRAFGGSEPYTGMRKFMPPAKFLSKAVMKKIPKDFENIAEDDFGFRDIAGILLLFSGCQDIEYSMDAIFNGRPNGAFTYYAIKALKDMLPGSTYSDLFKRIRTYLPSKDYQQTPNLFGKGMRSPIFG